MSPQGIGTQGETAAFQIRELRKEVGGLKAEVEEFKELLTGVQETSRATFQLVAVLAGVKPTKVGGPLSIDDDDLDTRLGS